jgi:hypothetical protein
MDDANEPHFETDAARGASSPNIVRWILLVSLFAAIALLSIIWMTGAATQTKEEGTVSHEVRDRSDVEATDSIVGENADELDAAEPGDKNTTPTVQNRAADEPATTGETAAGNEPVPDPETDRAVNAGGR